MWQEKVEYLATFFLKERVLLQLLILKTITVMYYTFNPIRHSRNASDNRTIEIPDSPFTRIVTYIRGHSEGFACNRGGSLFYNDNLNTSDIKNLYSYQLKPSKSLYDYTSCNPLSSYSDFNGAEVEFVSTTYSGSITNFYQTTITWDELDEDCYVLIYTNPDDPKNFNRITFMPSKGINYEEYELTNEQNHFHLHKIHKGNYKFSLFFDRVKETIRCNFGFFLAYYPGCYMYLGNRTQNENYDLFLVDWDATTNKSFGVYVLMAKDKKISPIPRLNDNNAMIHGSTFGDITWHNISNEDANVKVSLSYRMPLQLSMQDQFGNNVKWDYELYYYQVGFNNPPGAAFHPSRICWPATNNISPNPVLNYKYHIAGITWEYNIEPPKTYEEFVARVKDYGLNRLYFDPSEAHIDIPWPSWT